MNHIQLPNQEAAYLFVFPDHRPDNLQGTTHPQFSQFIVKNDFIPWVTKSGQWT
jgi:hypothetical protein